MNNTSFLLKNNWYYKWERSDFKESFENSTVIPDDAELVTLPISTYDTTDAGNTMMLYKRFGKVDREKNERVFIRFESTGYFSRVCINGKLVGEHENTDDIFEYDITDFIEDDNLLYLYCFMPTNDHRYKGYVFENLPATFNIAKVGHEPYIYKKPCVYINDVFVRPMYKTGEVICDIEICNTLDKDVTSTVSSRLTPHKLQVVSDSGKCEIKCCKGISHHTVTLQAEKDFKLWSPEEPNLYDVFLDLSTGGLVSSFTQTCGFKYLYVDDSGCFNLNGKRIFLKSIHTAHYYPGCADIDTDYDKVHRELSLLKLCGFNTIRYIHNCGHPATLNICDELGIMVYQEHSAGWLKHDCDGIEELFCDSLKATLKRDRNYASLCLFGMLNETWDRDPTSSQVACAVKGPTFLRDLAPDTLFMLSSGRFDGYLAYGSASNPGSYTWNGLFGNELGDGKQSAEAAAPLGTPKYGTYTGDVHIYPALPYSKYTREHLTAPTYGKRRSIITEIGIGSLLDVIGEYLLPLQYPEKPHSINHDNFMKAMFEKLLKAFDEYGLDKVFASPKELIEATEEMNSHQRKNQYTMLRAAGYSGISMTMTTDGDGSEEGITNCWLKVKKGMPEALADCLADMRWCIFFDKTSIYRGDALKYDVVLSQLNVIKEKTYYGTVTITGEEGTVYRHKFEFTPEKGEDGYIPFNIPVLNETVDTKDFVPGEYTLSILTDADMDPSGYSKKFTVYAKQTTSVSVKVVGISDEVIEKMKARGITIDDNADSIVVGRVESADELNKLYELANAGKHIMLLDSEGLKFGGADHTIPFPCGNLRWNFHYDGLYLFYNVLHNSKLLEGIKNRCIMKAEDWEAEYSYDYGIVDKVPDEIGISSYFTGLYGSEVENFVSAIKLGTWNYGSGKISISFMHILDKLGNPIADRLLHNLLTK